MQTRLVETVRAWHTVGDTPAMHRKDGVTNQREFGEIAGTKKHAPAAFGEAADQAVNLRLGRNVDALGRLFEKEYADFAGEPFGQNDLLLIAAGECRRRQAWFARADIQQFHQLRDQSVGADAVDAAALTTRQPAETRQQNVVARRQIHNEAQPAFTGHEADAGADRIRGTGDAPYHTIAPDAARLGADPEQPPQDPTGAAAKKSGQTGHFARAQSDRIGPFDDIFK